MLYQHDIDYMETTIRQIIKGWQLTIEVVSPLPPEKQPNWNPILHEYTGAISYTKYVNVIAERKDIQNMNISDFDIKDGAGDTNYGKLMFTMSDKYTWLDDMCMLIVYGERWKIDMIKKRIGEQLVLVTKFVASQEDWPEPVNIIDVGQDSGA